MSNDVDHLIQEFYDFFINLYHQTTGASPPETASTGISPQGAFLAFEPIGTGLTPDMFTLQTGDFSPLLATEHFSTLANTLPLLDGTTIKGPSIRSADGLYELLLVSAQPLPSVDRGPFDTFKREAVEAFDRAKSEPLLHDGREYRPAVATPPDWCAPGAAGGWTNRSFTQVDTIETSTGTGGPPPSTNPPVSRWNWRVASATLTPALDSQVAVQRVVQPRKLMMADVDTVELPPSHLAAVRRFTPQVAMMHPSLAAFAVQPAAAVAAPVRVAPAVIMTLRPEVLALHAQELAGTSASQEVTSKRLSLSFDYCLVTVTRPWLSTPLLSLKGWYVQGSKAGELASGTGTGIGPFEVIPMAALVARNLKITADWSQEDMVAAESFLKLGPFSLLGRAIDQVSHTISCAGMQIVGWVCEPMPLLPPASDPAQP